MNVQLDTCGCELGLGADGEPNVFVGNPCPRHTESTVQAVVAECRGKNAALAATGLTVDQVVWGIADDGTAHVGTLDIMSGQIDVLASSPPLTLDEFKTAIEGT